MARPTAPPARTGRPPVTSRAEILAVARRIIDAGGWDELTVRRLAAELGVGTTTLYRHVRDREDLLVQLVNEHAEQTLNPELPSAPRERILVAATAAHDALASWPWAAEVLTVDGLLGRLGRSALRVVEAIVAAGVEHGLTQQQAVDLFRHVWFYTVGEILVRARSRRAGGAPREDFFGGDVDLAELPHLAAVGDRWPAIEARDIYAEGLAALVDGLLARPCDPNRNGPGTVPSRRD